MYCRVKTPGRHITVSTLHTGIVDHATVTLVKLWRLELFDITKNERRFICFMTVVESSSSIVEVSTVYSLRCSLNKLQYPEVDCFLSTLRINWKCAVKLNKPGHSRKLQSTYILVEDWWDEARVLTASSLLKQHCSRTFSR